MRRPQDNAWPVFPTPLIREEKKIQLFVAKRDTNLNPHAAVSSHVYS